MDIALIMRALRLILEKITVDDSRSTEICNQLTVRISAIERASRR
jgi:hypothetical protein